MKAATGELNLTVITIVAIGAVIAFFTAVLWPQISKQISDSWNDETNYSGRDTGSAGMIIAPTGIAMTCGNYTISVK